MTGPDTGRVADRLAALERVVAGLRAKQDIRELAAAYQRAADGGWAGGTHTDPDFLTSLFTADARYQLPDTPECRGHEQIRACFERLQSVQWIIHYVGNDMLEIAEDGQSASGEIKGSAIYFQDGVPSLTYGTYVGRFVRESGRWRFADWEYVRAQQPVPVGMPRFS